MSVQNFINDLVSDVKEIIINSYDNYFKCTYNTMLDLFILRDDFIKAIDSYKYVDVVGNKITISIPDIDKLELDNNFFIIKFIVKGVVGEYYILSNKEIHDNKILNYISFYVVDKMFFLVNKKYISNSYDSYTKFIFSNNGPIDLFLNAEIYLDNKLKRI